VVWVGGTEIVGKSPQNLFAMPKSPRSTAKAEVDPSSDTFAEEIGKAPPVTIQIDVNIRKMRQTKAL
jgi:hypothetical protein